MREEFEKLWRLRESLLSLMPSSTREKLFEEVLGECKRASQERGDVIYQVLRTYYQQSKWDVYFALLYLELRRLKADVFRKNLGLVWKTLADLRIVQEQRQDAFQQGAIGLYRAVEVYNPKKGATFGSVAYGWIKAYVIDFLKKEKSYKGKFLSYDAPVREDADATFLDLIGASTCTFDDHFSDTFVDACVVCEYNER